MYAGCGQLGAAEHNQAGIDEESGWWRKVTSEGSRWEGPLGMGPSSLLCLLHPQPIRALESSCRSQQRGSPLSSPTPLGAWGCGTWVINGSKATILVGDVNHTETW